MPHTRPRHLTAANLVDADAGRRLDLALAVLETLPAPDAGWPANHIADIAGCAPNLIRHYERRALAKLRDAAVAANNHQPHTHTS